MFPGQVPSQVLPEGFALPPVPYLAAVVVAVLVVGGVLYRRRPPVTERVVVALAPWMCVGAATYAMFQVGAVPEPLAPLAGSPTVYLTTFAVMGAVWALVANRPADSFSLDAAPGVLFAVGTVLFGAVVASALVVGLRAGGLHPVGPAVAVVVGFGVAFLAWVGARHLRPVEAGRAGLGGFLVVFGHSLDGVSTAVGMSLGFGEQTPLSRLLIEVGQSLPTAQYVGGAWVFVLVKILLAVVIALVLGDYVHEDRDEGNLLLAAVAAVGLGPGAHNVVLFLIAAPVF